MVRKTVSQIFKECDELPDDKARVEYLRKNSSSQLKIIFDYFFNRELKFDLPPGAPPFKADDKSDNLEGRLFIEAKSLYRFLAPPRGIPGLSSTKKQRLFLDVLESIHPDDAKLLCEIKDKKVVTYKNVTKKLIQKAFPTLIKETKE